MLNISNNKIKLQMLARFSKKFGKQTHFKMRKANARNI
jgi:hypothetical protein